MKDNNPLFSVIVPVYNAEKYLSRCIDSILNQTYQNFELLLVDDGSKDKSGSICDKYGKTDSRVIAIHQSNSGPGTARNNGLHNAKGRYIIFVDSDDYLDSAYFEVVAENINEYDLLSFAHYNNYGEKLEKTDSKTSSLKKDDATVLFMDALNCGMTLDYLWDKVYDADIILNNKITFADVRTGEDTIFNIKYLSHCKRIRTDENAYYHYWITPNSISKGFQPDYLESNRLQIMTLKTTFDISNVQFKNFLINIETQRLVFGLICNYFRYKTPHISFREKISIIKNEIIGNKDLMNFLSLRECHLVSINQKILKLLILHTPFVVIVAYCNIIYLIKRL